MNLYQIPKEYFFRIHHPRPRFKTDVESKLIFMATEITKIEAKPKDLFNNELRAAIRRYPGNLDVTPKTIDNWRTEIDALFGFIKEEGKILMPSRRAIELADSQDLVKFFKLFCYHFQYPGGFLKPHRNIEFIQKNINFRPASYILNMLDVAEKKHGVRAGISKAEATHCLFNDLRVTRDAQSVEETWELILHNRKHDYKYDWNGDITRYAGDILDYMVLANLLSFKPNGKFYINHVENMAIQRFINETDNIFNYYDEIPDINVVEPKDLKKLELQWVEYMNTPKDESFFDTDILALITDTSDEYQELKDKINLDKLIEEGGLDTTSRIGDVGETLIFGHEKKRLIKEGRKDLIHLVKRIPTILAAGYDINSREIDETHRRIEVKTTASRSPVQFNTFHLTHNEWMTASSDKERYFIYRLMITKEGTKLIMLQDPVGLYKSDLISAIPRGNGMDISFIPTKCGVEETLLL